MEHLKKLQVDRDYQQELSNGGGRSRKQPLKDFTNTAGQKDGQLPPGKRLLEDDPSKFSFRNGNGIDSIIQGCESSSFQLISSFWKFSCAKISTFSFIFSLFLAFLPNFTLFFSRFLSVASHTSDHCKCCFNLLGVDKGRVNEEFCARRRAWVIKQYNLHGKITTAGDVVPYYKLLH